MSNVKKEQQNRPKIVLQHPYSQLPNLKLIPPQYCYDDNVETHSEFIRERTSLHKLIVIEIEKTKRISIMIAAALLILAVVVFVFSPAEKQTLSYWVGASLLVISTGAVGYKTLWFKSKTVEISIKDY